MEMKLAENIRLFRKQRSLTQEQLAEVLGVTVGAVYKWEAKLSQPELTMIMAMADFFDTSVDVLLGYEMKDNRLQATVERLTQYCHDKDRAGLAEAEKALKKYPNHFDIAYRSATLYRVFGLESGEKQLLARALELLEHSRLLLSQNTDPEISELSIYGSMAEVYLDMGECEQAVELWKQHNTDGIYNAMIGMTLASRCSRGDEALPFLSGALLQNTIALIRTVMGYVNVFLKKKDYIQAREILLWETGMLSGLKKENEQNILDKVNSTLLVCLACAHLHTGDADAARKDLREAKRLAYSFDTAPDYDMRSIRFVTLDKPVSAYDDLGITAKESLQNALAAVEDEALNALWKEITEHEA